MTDLAVSPGVTGGVMDLEGLAAGGTQCCPDSRDTVHNGGP